MNRRTALSTAWSIPVIAIAVAAPAASASTPPREPFECYRIPSKGQPQWLGVYSDGSTVNMDNGTAMSGEFGLLCRAV